MRPYFLARYFLFEEKENLKIKKNYIILSIPYFCYAIDQRCQLIFQLV